MKSTQIFALLVVAMVMNSVPIYCQTSNNLTPLLLGGVGGFLLGRELLRSQQQQQPQFVIPPPPFGGFGGGFPGGFGGQFGGRFGGGFRPRFGRRFGVGGPGFQPIFG